MLVTSIFETIIKKGKMRKILPIFLALTIALSFSFMMGCGSPTSGGSSPASGSSANPLTHITSIDGDAFYGSCLALDSSGKPNIYFIDANATPFIVWYRWNGKNWVYDDFMTIASSENGGLSMAMDTNGNKYSAGYFGGQLVGQVVDSGGTLAGGTIDQYAGTSGTYDAISVALDKSGMPFISYYDYTDKDLKLAKSADSGNTFELSTVESAGDVGRFSSIAINRYGSPEISYYDETNKDLRFAKWTGTAWDYTSIDTTGDVGKYTSIALDASDDPWISYYDETNGKLKCASFEGSTWYCREVDGPNVGLYTSIKVSSSGIPWISYYDVAGGLKLASLEAGDWNCVTIESGPQKGLYTSLALDSLGRPRIAYISGVDHTLMYYWK